MADKTFNLKVVGSMRDLKGLLEGSLTSFRIPDGVTSLHQYGFYQFSQLTDLDFNQVEIIPGYCCGGCSNLTRVVFSTNTTKIGYQAFYQCTKLDITELPHTLTYIGADAFREVGSYYNRGTHTFTMTNNAGVYTTIGDMAFYKSHLGEITAYLNDVGGYAFSYCSSLTKVDIEIHGPLRNSAFYESRYIKDFRINPNSVITSLGNSVFRNFASSHIADFDFRKSTFASLDSGVWEKCYFNGNVFFPSTLKSIYGDFLSYATGNWMLYFNSVPSVSSSSYLRDDSPDTFTVKYAFPYTQLDTALVATNWSSHASQMVGYGTGFEVGTTLPAYRRDTGVGITWYSDVALTTPVTTSSSATDTYYCSLGSTRLFWFVDALSLYDASVTISDGAKTYSVGDPIPVDTSLTITPNYTDPTKNQLYFLSVNGVDYTSTGSASITMTQGLYIEVIYWNGTDSPIFPTLSDTSWTAIKRASQTNSIPSTWNIGDTKTFTYNGDTYTARLVDKTGKYKRASDDSTAYLGFEVTELLPDSEKYNKQDDNRPAQSELLAKMNSGAIWDNMDADLKAALEAVKVKVSQGGGSSTENTIIDWEGKLFLPREHDLFSKRYSSVPAEWDLITQDQYYQVNDTNAARCKRGKTSSSESRYWEMGPNYNHTHSMCVVSNQGYADQSGYYSSGSFGVAVRFAL